MLHSLAVIGGSGFYAIPGLVHLETIEQETPYGRPSGGIIVGELEGVRLLYLPRHGEHHEIAPHKINYRANVCALKLAGATHILSLSAVGSMREELQPGDVVTVTDYIDWTRKRASTFFDEGVVAHVSMATPVCPLLSDAVFLSAQAAGARTHRAGTYLCIEGPQFSTRAESKLFRRWEVDVIGMTAMPEAKLAREAELPYATAAFITDYDCWRDSESPVSVEQVLGTLANNADLAPKIVVELLKRLPNPELSQTAHQLQNSIITRSEYQSREARNKLGWLMPT
jgi:5'-methylthioadenosine phosphorylase